jgi:hypothetical protein
MRRNLTLFCTLILAVMVGVSIWATAQLPIQAAIAALVADPRAGTHPWFIATLFDTYFAFLWFWLWVAYKETSPGTRVLWLALIFALGNIAMAAYVLLQLRRLPADTPVEALLLRRA